MNYGPILIGAAAVLVIVARLHRRGLLRLPWPRGDRSRRPSDAPPRLGEVGLVAGREIRQRLRGRTFRIATGLLLVGVAAAIVIPVLTRGHTETEQVGVVGTSTPALQRAVATAGRTAETKTQLVTEPDRASAEAALRSGSLDVAVIDGRTILVHKAAARDDSFPRALAGVLGLDRAVRDAGLSTAQAARLARAGPLPVVSLEPATATGAGRSTAAIGMIVMFVLLTQYLTWTLIGVMEEKSNRVVEVLLAALRPLQLLTGKVLGIGAVVFAQAAVVGAFALVLARIVGSDLLHGTAPLVLLSAVGWLLLGYAFYSWLYAAAGSTMERQDQVQTLAIPLSLPLIVSYVLGITVTGSGSAPIWFEVLAYLPPSAPFAMTTLVGLGAVAWWQFVLSAGITVASAVGVARLAAAVYRRAILRTGKRVPLRELVRR